MLFVQTKRNSENKLKFWNDNFRYMRDGEIVNQMSCHKLLAVFIVGDISITNVILQKSKEYGISIHLLKHNMEEYASILSQTEGHYLLRHKQYNFDQELAFSKHLVENKISNQYALLKQISKQQTLLKDNFTKSISQSKNNQELLGIEGNASKVFFSAYFGDYEWKKREPQTKRDINNFLLDMGYYYLFNFVDSLLRLYGFDTYKGIYHKLFFQRRSLACDVMEPFRCLIEHELRKAYNLKMIKRTDFSEVNGKVSLSFQKSSHYSEIFIRILLKNREIIYGYIRDFYRFMLDNDQPFPTYKFPTR